MPLMNRILKRLSFLALALILSRSLLPHGAFAGGVVASCTEGDLNAALANGGTVTFACDGTITLTSTKIVTTNTTVDASGHRITISGGNAVRVFTVNSNASLTLLNLSIANGKNASGGGLFVTNNATLFA